VRFRHAIFDLDGTLVDSLPGIAWSLDAALDICGLPPTSIDVASLIGPPVRSILASVSAAADADLLDRLERGFRQSYDSDGWRRTAAQPGVRQMLVDLMSAGVALWLVTNKPALVAAQILQKLELQPFFVEVACRDSRPPAFASKSEVLSDLIARHRLDRPACLMIGDTAEDWRAAEAAGIACVIVPHGYGKDCPSACHRIAGWDELREICFGAAPDVIEAEEVNA
jgi:phosphoglycolate phosphatase